MDIAERIKTVDGEHPMVVYELEPMFSHPRFVAPNLPSLRGVSANMHNELPSSVSLWLYAVIFGDSPSLG